AARHAHRTGRRFRARAHDHSRQGRGRGARRRERITVWECRVRLHRERRRRTVRHGARQRRDGGRERRRTGTARAVLVRRLERIQVRRRRYHGPRVDRILDAGEEDDDEVESGSWRQLDELRNAAEPRMPNRTVTFTGIHFENPFLLSSAPPTESESNIQRAFDAGWGGVVVKTIGLHPVVNVVGARTKVFRTSPEDKNVSMKKRPGSALHGSWNWELISDKSIDWWVPKIRKIKQAHPTKVVIASIMAGSGSDKELRAWQTLTEAVQEAGSDGIECNFSCPHMDRKDMGSNIGKDE